MSTNRRQPQRSSVRPEYAGLVLTSTKALNNAERLILWRTKMKLRELTK